MKERKLRKEPSANIVIIESTVEVGDKRFDWDAVEKRADREESQGRFIEFGNVKDLLSDLHSSALTRWVFEVVRKKGARD